MAEFVLQVHNIIKHSKIFIMTIPEILKWWCPQENLGESKRDDREGNL